MCAFMCGSLKNFDDYSQISVHKSCAVISRIVTFSFEQARTNSAL